jgi:hypothetical protein
VARATSRPGPQTPEPWIEPLGWLGTTWYARARAAGGLGIAFLAIGSVLLLAPALVLLVISFFPELPPERRARRRLKESHGRRHD